MFKLRSLHGDVGVLHARRVQLGLRLRNVGLGGHASFEAIYRELQVIGVGFDRVVEKLFLSVGAAQFEIVQGKFRLEAELGGLIVGGGRLRFFSRALWAT